MRIFISLLKALIALHFLDCCSKGNASIKKARRKNLTIKWTFQDTPKLPPNIEPSGQVAVTFSKSHLIIIICKDMCRHCKIFAIPKIPFSTISLKWRSFQNTYTTCSTLVKKARTRESLPYPEGGLYTFCISHLPTTLCPVSFSSGIFYHVATK